MYNALAKVVKDSKDAETFRQLAAEEGHHAAVFKAMTNEVLKPKSTKAIVIPILYRIIGKKKLYPIIARKEYDAVKKYAPVAARFLQSFETEDFVRAIESLLAANPRDSI